MDSFEFVVVLLAIIIGLGVAELLTNVAKLIKKAPTIRFHWMPLTLVGLIFIAFLQMWWEAWALHTVENWNMLSIAHMLGAPIGLFIMSHLIFPDELENADLKAHYFRIARPFWLILAASVIVASLYWPLSQGVATSLQENISSGVLVIIALSLAIFRAERFHGVAIAIAGAAALTDLALFSWRIAN